MSSLFYMYKNNCKIIQLIQLSVLQLQELQQQQEQQFRQRHSSLAPEKGRQIGNRNGKENTNGSSIKPPPVIE